MTAMTTHLSPWSLVRDGGRLIARFVRAHPGAFSLGVLGGALFASAIVAAAVVVGWVTDWAIIPVLDGGVDPAGRLLPAAAAVVGVAIWKAGGIVLRRTAAGWLQFRTRQDVRNQLLDHQMGLRLSWFQDRTTGDLLAVADVDTDQGTGILSPLPYFTAVILLLVGTLALITLIDPWLGLGALVGLALIVGIDMRAAWVTYLMWEDVQRQRGVVSSIAHESFDGALTVKALGREDHEAGRFGRASELLRDRLIRVNGTWVSYQAVLRVLPAALIVALLVLGAFRMAEGAVTAGNLISIAYLLSLLSFPIQLIGYVLWELSGSLAGWRRVERVFQAEDRVPYGTERARPEAGPAPVQGDSVRFGYTLEEPVLEDLGLDLAAGRTVAVVGATGSGKSTLALLLARLWDPVSGDIRLDGRDLRAFAPSELPREVAYVAQQSFLFQDTVAGNITLGEPFSEEEVEAAARLAGAHEFVATLPEGYQTLLGERGATLSGGQQQRVALARALVRRPRLLILDDATSAVDPSIEGEILRGLRAATLPSTIVVVAYRPASIRLADEVLFVEGGRVAAHGTHEELLRVASYARLVRAYEEDAAQREAGR